MNINIYYGGRGLLDDPTLYVIDKMEAVLKELRVKVERYNIFEHKNVNQGTMWTGHPNEDTVPIYAKEWGIEESREAIYNFLNEHFSHNTKYCYAP